MRPIDGDALYAALKDAGMVFALRMVKSAPTIAPPPNAPLTLDQLRKMGADEFPDRLRRLRGDGGKEREQ